MLFYIVKGQGFNVKNLMSKKKLCSLMIHSLLSNVYCQRLKLWRLVADENFYDSTLPQFNSSTVSRFHLFYLKSKDCSMETADCVLFPKYTLAAGLSGRYRPYYPRSAIYRYGSICSAGFDNLSLCFGLFPLFCLCRCNASGCR